MHPNYFKPAVSRQSRWHLPPRLYRLSVAFGLPSSWSALALFPYSLVLSFLVSILSLSCLFFALSALRLSSSSCPGLGFFLTSRLVLSCCVSFLVFVSCCLVLPLPLSLFCLIGVVLVFLLCCAVCLSSWVALSTHFWSFWVVSGVDVGHFGSSWGALGVVLRGLLGVLRGLERSWGRLARTV